MPPTNLRLDPFDILSLVAMPGEPGVFVLPTRERPNRIVSQQRRALTIAHALVESRKRTGANPSEFRLAVIGGGFGGVTAALYAAQAGARVTLFERKKEVLERFANSKRHVDPCIADWPDDTWTVGSGKLKAGLRILDWEAKEVEKLAKEAITIARRAPSVTNLDIRRSAEAVLLPYGGSGSPRRLMWSSGDRSGTDVFHAVLTATGFGEERLPKNWSQTARASYWAEDVHLSDVDRTIAIIGNGDGALMEVSRLLGVPIHKQREWIEWATKAPNWDKMTESIRKSEAEWKFDRDTSARAGDRASEVTKAYFKQADFLSIKASETAALDEEPSELEHIYVFGRSTDLLTLDTYPINRILVALLLKSVGGATGRYESRFGRRRIALDYVCADAEIEHNGPPIRLRAIAPGSTDPTATLPIATWGLMSVDAVIPRLGPEPVDDHWARISRESREPANKGLAGRAPDGEGRINVSRLNLLERNVPSQVLDRVDALGSWPTLSREGAGQRLRFASEFYDTYIQKLAVSHLKEKFLDVYLGKLRLDTILWNTVVLTDTQVFDGCFFHRATDTKHERWPELENILAPADPARWGKVGIYARNRESFEDSLAMFLAGTEGKPRDGLPELSALGLQAETTLRKLDIESGKRTWDKVKSALKKLKNSDIDSLVTRLDDLKEKMKNIWTSSAEQWADSFYVIPTMDLFDILKELDNEEFEKFRQDIGPAVRANGNRTDVFIGIREATKEDPLTLQPGSMAEFVAWYNSSYNLGIFDRAKVDAGEFLWIPPDAAPTADRIGEVCMQCLAKWDTTKLKETIASVRQRKDLRGRIEVAMIALNPSQAEASTEHSKHLRTNSTTPRTVAEKLEQWTGPVSVELTPTGWRYAIGNVKEPTILSRVEFTDRVD